MYTSNLASQEVEKQPSEIKNLFIMLQDQNERFFQLISGFENIGNKLKSNNDAKESALNQPKPISNGLIYDIGEQIDRYRQLNNRLDELGNKFNSLI